MKWLVVVDSKLVQSMLQKLLKKASAQAVPFSDPVPLSEAETSIEVDGPEDLPNRLKSYREIKGVYPSSDYTLY